MTAPCPGFRGERAPTCRGTFTVRGRELRCCACAALSNKRKTAEWGRAHAEERKLRRKA